MNNKSYRYAQVDENGNLISDSYLSGIVKSPFMIPLDNNIEVIGKKYNFETKEWEVVEIQSENVVEEIEEVNEN